MSGHAIPRTALGRCKGRHKTVMDVTEDVDMGDEKVEKEGMAAKKMKIVNAKLEVAQWKLKRMKLNMRKQVCGR